MELRSVRYSRVALESRARGAGLVRNFLSQLWWTLFGRLRLRAGRGRKQHACRLPEEQLFSMLLQPPAFRPATAVEVRVRGCVLHAASCPHTCVLRDTNSCACHGSPETGPPLESTSRVVHREDGMATWSRILWSWNTEANHP